MAPAEGLSSAKCLVRRVARPAGFQTVRIEVRWLIPAIAAALPLVAHCVNQSPPRGRQIVWSLCRLDGQLAGQEWGLVSQPPLAHPTRLVT
jgi:hypothetical protein